SGCRGDDAEGSQPAWRCRATLGESPRCGRLRGQGTGRCFARCRPGSRWHTNRRQFCPAGDGLGEQRGRPALGMPSRDRPAQEVNYAATVSITSYEAMGWLRAAVGVALIAAPAVPMRLSGREEPTGASVLLMRTIGIRDLVLGLGTVVAARSAETGDVARWNAAALASDSLDTLVSLASFRSIGKRDAWVAGALAFAFVCGDLEARRERSG